MVTGPSAQTHRRCGELWRETLTHCGRAVQLFSNIGVFRAVTASREQTIY